MDDIIKSLSEKLALPEATVRSAVEALLALIKDKTSEADFGKFVGLIPGCQDLISQIPKVATGAPGGLGGLFGMLGGQAADLAKASSALQAAGVPADKILPLAREFFEKAQEAVGPEVFEEMSKSFPILKSLLKS